MQNECIFSDPVVLNESGDLVSASNSAELFQFQRATCNSTPSAGFVLPIAIYPDQLRIGFVVSVFVLFFIGFYIVTYIFRRNV